jgi:protein-tyrosine phosphatase
VVDTHCHLVPGVDDGPRTTSDAVALAKSLEAEGVYHVVCTPHYSRQFPTDQARAAAALEILRQALEAASVDLRMTLAAEISPAYAADAPLEELRKRTLADRFAIVEILADTPFAFFDTVEERLNRIGLRAVFAHPERCRAVQRDPGVLTESRARGSLVQVVAPSLLGRWGPEPADTAWRLIERGDVDLVGSDAHGSLRRRVHLREAAELITDRVGSVVAADLVERRPGLVVEGRY